jgi:arabinose-5-phosphate isomerase
MHTGDAVPIVPETAAMKDVVYEMSKKRFGITSVVDAGGRLAGAISDGDLRRLLERHGSKAMELSAGEAMSRSPKTIPATAFATAALLGMEEQKITSFFVVDDGGRPEGILHLHDLWGIESI